MPDWVAKPVAADITRFYPAAAKATKLEGSATITCRVDDEGRLGQCQLLREAPEGAGFGQAALSLADTFQMKPLDKEGRATAGQDVRIPFKFALPAPAAPVALVDRPAQPGRLAEARPATAASTATGRLSKQLISGADHGWVSYGAPDFWPVR
jgi:TonB family protein